MLEIRKKKIVAQINLLKNSIIMVSIFIFRSLLWSVRLSLKKLELILKC